MAFECGFLGSSQGHSPREVLKQIIEVLQGNAAGVSSGEIKEGQGWAATTAHIAWDGVAPFRQYIQASVGGEILKIYLESAREQLDPELLHDKDLMVTTTLSGPEDPRLMNMIMLLGRNGWAGIPWDETDGFMPNLEL